MTAVEEGGGAVPWKVVRKSLLRPSVLTRGPGISLRHMANFSTQIVGGFEGASFGQGCGTL